MDPVKFLDWSVFRGSPGTLLRRRTGMYRHSVVQPILDVIRLSVGRDALNSKARQVMRFKLARIETEGKKNGSIAGIRRKCNRVLFRLHSYLALEIRKPPSCILHYNGTHADQKII